MEEAVAKPGRRDYTRNSKTQRRTPTRDVRTTTLEVIVPRSADRPDPTSVPSIEGARGTQRELVGETLNLNRHRNWELVDQLKRDGESVVVVSQSARELERAAVPHENKARPVKPAPQPTVETLGKSRAGPVVKTNKSQAQRKREQQALRQEAATKGAKPVYVVKHKLSDAQRRQHSIISRDGGESGGCSCRGCRGWVKEEPTRQKRAEVLLDL